MVSRPEFVQKFLSSAKALLKQKAVADPLFSRGTYQLEVREGKEKFFPFLQIKDTGEVTDFFCTCSISEQGHGCPHLAAGYLRILGKEEVPLHVRFQQSFWNALFQIQALQSGYETKCLKSKEGKYRGEFFSLTAKTASAKKQLKKWIEERAPETEETSLKFFNLPAEGNPSPELQYELSFWSDLAKWLFLLAEKGEYQIVFRGEPLPQQVHIVFSEVVIDSTIHETKLLTLIPTLATVHSSLSLFDAEEGIESIVYDEKERTFFVQRKQMVLRDEPTGIGVGEWVYVENKGFYRKRSGSLLQQQRVDSSQISSLLSHAAASLQRFLPIFPQPRKCQYRLFFDAEAALHIELYVFEVGDLLSERAACFFPWVYVPGKGFYLLEDFLFEGKEKVIAKQNVADFINNNRVWLHQFPGFQTHLGSLESHLVYRLNERNELLFEAELNFPQEYDEFLNFDEWVYIKGQGFYMKKESRGRLPLHPGLVVAKEEIAPFIASHREELEQVQGFFSSSKLLENIGLVLELNEEERITLEPKRKFVPGIDPAKVQIFGNFLYLEGKGFAEIPLASRLPERYQERTVIPQEQEAAFLTYELDPLKPCLIHIDPRLQKPHHLQLKIERIEKTKAQEWLVTLFYESEIGRLSPFPLWDAIQEKKKHLFSPAGLLFLKDLRFNWLRQLSRRRLERNKEVIRLSTLEWIRLTIFEDLPSEQLPPVEPDRLLDLSQLQATLRPYQEQGVHWLWFLYCHGLSGLLCDDMGLGKTHQTMALLAAIAQEDPERKNKYLVVCPTSVIYHWQELLKRFLPEMRVCIYHGLQRSQEDLVDFENRFDILVTSYGILRTGRENLGSLFFEVAIYDEIQIAKNHASQTHQALRAIRASMRLGLSGTPIENRIRELKALFDLVLPGYLPNDASFRDLFILPIEKEDDAEKKVLLGKLIKPFVLRRKKSEVLRDLPEKIEEIAYCDLSEEQKKLYREIVLPTKETLYSELQDSSKPTPYLHVFSLLSRLKQVCDHPCLISGNLKDFHLHQSGKFELFMELLNEARGSGQKVVVFSQFLDMLAIIENWLKKKGVFYASIKGSTRDRSEELRKFREDPQCEVFVASLLAAGVGIDLTVASIVIHYDRWWNPAKENQATDRVHRIGQNRGVQVFKLVTKNTIEEHIHEMIERKKGLLEQIVQEEDQIRYLSRAELVAVFEKIYTEIE